jgi:recombinational DNA repair protein RecR
MTKLLQEAIEHLRALPKEEQDSAAEVVFAFISSDERQYRSLPRNFAQPSVKTNFDRLF